MKNVLYFEGAGMDFYSEEQTNFSDVGNFRIRTAFKNLDGVAYYIEMGNGYIYDKKGKNVERFSMWIDYCFEIPKDKDEKIQYHKVFNRAKYHLKVRELNYTKQDITKWINENLNCNFDTIEVLDYFQGYHVHADNGGYNLIEDADIDHDRANRRKAAYNKVDMEYRKLLNEKYSVITLNDMNNNSITIKCHVSKDKIGDIPRVQTIAI